MRVEDVFVQNRRFWVRLHEKGGKCHEMRCHRNLEEYLDAHLRPRPRRNRKAPLSQMIGRGTGRLSGALVPEASAHQMVRRRTAAATTANAIGNHSFRATGSSEDWRHAETRRANGELRLHPHHQPYDRRRVDVALDKVMWATISHVELSNCRNVELSTCEIVEMLGNPIALCC